MPVRRFSGSVSSYIQLAGGEIDPTGAVTIAALVRHSNLGSDLGGVMALGETGDTGWADLAVSQQGALVYWGDGWASSPGPNSRVSTGEWYLVAASKAAGSATPRLHVYRFSNSTWSHDNGSSSVSSHHTQPSVVTLGHGGIANFTFFVPFFLSGDLAAAASWSKALSDQEVEGLASVSGLNQWLSSGPDALWLLNQESTATPVVDLTGNGADQTAQSGTTVIPEDPPIPYEGGAGLKMLTPGGWDEYPLKVLTPGGWQDAAELGAL